MEEKLLADGIALYKANEDAVVDITQLSSPITISSNTSTVFDASQIITTDTASLVNSTLSGSLWQTNQKVVVHNLLDNYESYSVKDKLELVGQLYRDFIDLSKRLQEDLVEGIYTIHEIMMNGQTNQPITPNLYKIL